MTPNGDVIQSNVIFGGSRPLTEKQMAPLDFWGHSASETGLCFSKFDISKFGIFDMTLTPGLVARLTHMDSNCQKTITIVFYV